MKYTFFISFDIKQKSFASQKSLMSYLFILRFHREKNGKLIVYTFIFVSLSSFDTLNMKSVLKNISNNNNNNNNNNNIYYLNNDYKL